MRNLVTDGGDDNQYRMPFLQQREAVGHAVRANYLYAGAADLYAETGDGQYEPERNRYANSIVALRLSTGELVWSFQTVRHDLWDYDLPQAPKLLTIRAGRRTRDVVAQATKHGLLFVFDRKSGEPIWPIVERPVPASLVPEEKLATTQPFVTKPAPFDLQGRTEDHLIDYTPAIKKLALERAQKLDLLAPLFAPPTHRGNKEGKGPANICPGGGGGANITGPPAADPTTGILFITSTSGCSPTLLAPASERDNDKMTGKTLAAWITSRGEKPAPPKRDNDPLAGFPDIFKGPLGRLVAIDMNTGEHIWMTPHGDSPTTQQEAMRANPLLKGVANVDTNWGRRGHAALQPGLGLALRKEILVRRGAIRHTKLRYPGSALTPTSCRSSAIRAAS